MSSSSTISSKGRITLPLEIRHRLGLKARPSGIIVDDGRTIIRPAHPPGNPFEKYAGALPAFSSKHKVNSWVRSLRDEEAPVE